MNTLRVTHLVLAGALAFGSAAAMAQAAIPEAGGERAQKMAAELQKRFTAADTNGDGRLTNEEAKGKMPLVYKHFDEIDAAHAGAVSMADIAAFARTQRAARKSAS